MLIKSFGFFENEPELAVFHEHNTQSWRISRKTMPLVRIRLGHSESKAVNLSNIHICPFCSVELLNEFWWQQWRGTIM